MTHLPPPEPRLRGARGAILARLRRGDATIADLAPAVGLTPNGVRLHVGQLEREGLVERVGARPGVSKSSRLYGLSPAGRRVFSRAYGAFLAGLVAELAEQDARSRGGMARLFQAVARRLGPGALPDEDRGLRRARALDVLRGLGGDPVVRGEGETVEVEMAHCPLADVSAIHPEVCEFGRSLVAAWTGESVATHCTRGARPHCRFELGPPAKSAPVSP